MLENRGLCLQQCCLSVNGLKKLIPLLLTILISKYAYMLFGLKMQYYNEIKTKGPIKVRHEWEIIHLPLLLGMYVSRDEFFLENTSLRSICNLFVFCYKCFLLKCP